MKTRSMTHIKLQNMKKRSSKMRKNIRHRDMKRNRDRLINGRGSQMNIDKIRDMLQSQMNILRISISNNIVRDINQNKMGVISQSKSISIKVREDRIDAMNRCNIRISSSIKRHQFKVIKHPKHKR